MEFGSGLSYTQFKFSGIKADSSKLTGPVNVSCTIKNTGKAAGKEVAQVYISGPKGQFNRPAVELKAFGKTKLLAPGESERLSFKLAEADFASYDPAVSAWVVAPGTYKICVGASSKDIKSTAKHRCASSNCRGTGSPHFDAQSRVFNPHGSRQKIGT